MAEDDELTYRREATRVTLIGSLLDLLLGVLKIAVGAMAQSQALIADGLHSLSDLLTDFGVLAVTRYARSAPDPEHPYGHERFETLASLLLGAVLFMVAGGIAWDSIERLLQGRFDTPGAWALAVAALSIAGKEWIFRYTRRVADRLRSQMLLANAWHSRTDAFSSIAVLVGVAGAMLGWPWLDLLAALAVAAMVGWIAWTLLLDAGRELVDTGLSADALARLRIEALSVPGVVGVHHVRSRRMGRAVLLDLDILVPPSVSVSEGHQIGYRVQQHLRRALQDLREVKIHVDSDMAPTRADLPLRAEAEALLLARWRPLLEGGSVERLTLHYGQTGIDVDLFLSGTLSAPGASASDSLPTRLAAAAEDLQWLGRVEVWSALRGGS